MKVTNHQDMSKVFQSLQKKLGITTGYSTFALEALKTNVWKWVILNVNTIESTSSSWTRSTLSHDQGRFFKRFSIICNSGTLNLRNLQTRSSSCQCSATLVGQEKETTDFVFPIQNKSRNYAKRFSQGRWTFFCPGDEKKWYGKAKYPLEGKCDSVAPQMV